MPAPADGAKLVAQSQVPAGLLVLGVLSDVAGLREALHRVLLDPLGPDGDRRIQLAVYDKVTDIALSPPVTTAAIDAVLLFDGVFLLRKELFDRWDLRIFVSATFEKTLDRARIRDQTPLMSANEVKQRYRSRYIPSQEFYFKTIRPTEHADIIVYNDEPFLPAWDIRTV
jgi:uridine kinase